MQCDEPALSALVLINGCAVWMEIGALITQLLLKWNGYRLVLQKNELADMFIAIADGQAGEEDLLNWIRNHIH